MITAILFVIIWISYIIQFTWAIYLLKKKATYHLVLFLIFIIVLFYDGFIISMGYFLVSTGTFFEFISWFRFIFHVLIPPIIMFVVLEQGIEYEIKWCKFDIKIQRIIIGILSIVILLIGYFTHFIGIQIEIGEFDGVLKYNQIDGKAPIASILIVIVLIIMGIQFGRKTNWKIPWILIGSIIMFLVPFIMPNRLLGPAPSSFAEMILTLSILLVYHKIYKNH